MRGVLLTGHGGPEKLVSRDDVPVPHPESTDVLVHVEAAGVNNTGINTREAWYSKGNNEANDASWSGTALKFPRIQGADVCGTIVQAGTEVDEARVRDRVWIEPCLREVNGKLLESPWYLGSECDGGFAEYAVVASRHAHKINSSLSGAELASFPCSYSTAENMLTRADVNDQDHVLITGASGGVGSAAIQLAKARGAHVTAVTSSLKAAELRDLGADKTVTRDEDLTTSLGVNNIDVVIDLVAGPSWVSLLKVLRPGGRYAVSGAIFGPGPAVQGFWVRMTASEPLKPLDR